MLNLKHRIRYNLTKSYGNFNSMLEKEYYNYITEKLYKSKTYNDRIKWLIYNQVIVELKHNVKNITKTKEIQYIITDVAEPNDLIMEVLENYKNINSEIHRLYLKMINL